MTSRRGQLSALLVCLALPGCGGGLTRMVARIDPTPHPVSNDIPTAQPLDESHARTLFLIVVKGLRDAGKPSAALAYLQSYIKLYPDDPAGKLLQADCLVQTQQAAAAAPIYTALLGTADAAPAQAGLARIAAGSGAWADAAQHFRQASSLDAANADYLNDLGYAQIMTGQYAPSVTTLRAANELDPDSARVRDNLILGLHLSGQDAEARALVGTITPDQDRAAGANLLTLNPADLHRASQPGSQALASADPHAPLQNSAQDKLP